MMNYEIVKVNETEFDILEVKSGTQIVLRKPADEVKTIVNRLKSGAGFHEFTPQFFASY